MGDDGCVAVDRPGGLRVSDPGGRDPAEGCGEGGPLDAAGLVVAVRAVADFAVDEDCDGERRGASVAANCSPGLAGALHAACARRSPAAVYKLNLAKTGPFLRT